MKAISNADGADKWKVLHVLFLDFELVIFPLQIPWIPTPLPVSSMSFPRNRNTRDDQSYCAHHKPCGRRFPYFLAISKSFSFNFPWVFSKIFFNIAGRGFLPT